MYTAAYVGPQPSRTPVPVLLCTKAKQSSLRKSRPQHFGLRAKGFAQLDAHNIGTVLTAARVTTLLWLFDRGCQHTQMGAGYNPAARLKFTQHHQREDRHVTTPPNDLSGKKKKEIKIEKWGRLGAVWEEQEL